MARYKITLWKLTGKEDEVESKHEFFAETTWNAIELFDLVQRGVRGHFRMWQEDTAEDRHMRSAELTWKSGI